MATYDKKAINSFINFIKFSKEKSSAVYHAFINELPAGLEWKNIVDLGCGPANITQQVASANPQSIEIGLDENEHFLRYAKVQCAALPNVQFKQGNMNTMEDFEDNSIDVAISRFAFFVHTTKIQDAVDCLAQKIKKGGKFIFETGCYESKSNRELPCVPVPLRLAEDFIVLDYLYATSQLHHSLSKAFLTDMFIHKQELFEDKIDACFPQKHDITYYESVITAVLC